MTIAEKVAELQAGGLVAARRILEEILRPTRVQATAPLARPGAAQERALRDLIVPELLSSAAWNTRAADGTLEDRVSLVLALRLKQAADNDARVAALTLAALIDNQERLVRRKGGEPYAPAAGNDTRSETSFADGPSWWATNFPGQPVPTIQQIREAMQ